MIMDLDKIKQQSLEMKQDIENENLPNKKSYIDKYNYIYRMSPTLFEVIYKNEINHVPILNSLISIKKKNKPKYDADVEAGEELANIYLYPLKKP